MKSMVTLVALASLAAFAVAADIPLTNGDFESSPPGYNSPIPEWHGGGDFNHADTGMSPPPELGLQFGFLGNGTQFGAWQATALVLAAGTTYTFDSWVLVRNNGVLPLGIGYLDEANHPQLLSFVVYGNTYPTWTHVDGVTYTPAPGSTGLGRPLVVGYAGSVAGLHEGDTWFDNAHAAFTPEPAGLLLAALGLLIRRR
jgi:hypothetical protein